MADKFAKISAIFAKNSFQKKDELDQQLDDILGKHQEIN